MSKPSHAAPRVEVDLYLLGGLVAVIIMTLVVVAMKLVREGYAVAAVLERHAAAREEPVVEPAEAGAAVRQFGRRVLDGALRRVVVTGPPQAAAGPEQQVVLRVLQADIGARLRIRAAGVGRDLRPRTFEQRLPVALMRRDHVDEAANRVRSVQQRRRPAHDLDPLGAVRVDRDAVVARLARQIPGAYAVLQDQDAVAVEAADDRPARAGAEAPAGNAGLLLQGVAETTVQLPHEIERVERRHRVERFERRLGAPRRRGHGHVLVHGRQNELEVDRGRPTRGQGNHLPARGQVLALREHLVAARRHGGYLERAILGGQSDQARAHDEHHRPVNRPTVYR